MAAPEGPGDQSKGFFPLDTGNEWMYAGDFLVVIDGDTASVTGSSEKHTIIGTEERFGREYVLERQVRTDEDGDTLTVYWVRYRQDKAGLYEADIALTEPPFVRGLRVSAAAWNTGARSEYLARAWRRAAATMGADRRRAYTEGWECITRRLGLINSVIGREAIDRPASQGRPGGVLPDEITRLGYPLHPGREWVVRDDGFLVTGVVDSHDVLDLAPGRMNGWKVMFLNANLGPNDIVEFWYGRAGFLGLNVHVEQEIVDPGGNPLGTLVAEEQLYLEDLDLAGGGRW
jgi:hypothetical protein